MSVPTRSDVEAAQRRIDGHIRHTPAWRADGPRGTPLWIKGEFLQHTGSFKARGAFNRVLSMDEQDMEPTVVAASGGNAGLAFAHAASSMGRLAVVFVPETAPAVKVARLRGLGADVRQVGTEYAHAFDAAMTYVESRPEAAFCHAYDQPEVVAGQGTVALELLEQAEGGLDTLVLVVGGGGLMGGCAAALDGAARIVAVEPESAPTLHTALETGHPVEVPVGGVAADSLGARRAGDLGFALTGSADVVSVLVSDEDIVAARQDLWDTHRIVVEHGTAAAWAALSTGAYAPAAGERVGVLLCGANTDPATLAH